MPDIELTTPTISAFSDAEIAAAEKEADQCGDRFTTEQVLEFLRQQGAAQ